MNFHFRYLFCFFILFVSCKKDIGKVNYGNYPNEIGKIISSNCAVSGCHNSASYKAAGGYNLETWADMFAGSYNGSPVIPYSARFSSLCYYINTYSSLGPENKPTMPLNKPSLSVDQVKNVMSWINNGAPDVNGTVMWTGDAGRKKLYVVNQGCDVVTVIDAETRLPIRYIDVGTKLGGKNTPHHLRVSPDGKYWYVVFINNNVMQKFSCADDSYVGSIPLTPFSAGTSSDPNDDALDWNTFVISGDSKRAYCVSWTASGKVTAVDLENRKLLHYLPGFAYPHGITLNGAEDKIYVTAQTGNYITELDTAFAEVPLKISLQNGVAPSAASSLNVHDVILSPDQKNLLATCISTDEVRVYNFAQNKVTDVIQTGVYPQEIIYSKYADAFFVSCTNDSTRFPNSLGVITRIKSAGFSADHMACGYQPHGIAADDNNGILYVASRNISPAGPLPHHTNSCGGRNGFVDFISLGNFTLLDQRYELSVDPYFINARP